MVFPKRTKKDKQKLNANKSKRNTKNQKETKKKQTPQGGGWWPKPPCLSA
jgi:hypothetical protein